MTALLYAHVQAGGSALASWTPLVGMLIGFAVVITALVAFGRSGDTEHPLAAFVLRAPMALERLTGVPGWAAATVGLSLFGLLMAGQGFYSDVAWHVGLGRDKNLFTAPHTSIVIGLGLIFGAALAGIGFASLQRVDTRLRWRAVRVPWSTLPLLALGGAAVSGFPLDELWHRAFGIDVTMWSPTHMLMILGASFSGLASWLVLADAGVRPNRSGWALGFHVLAAWLTLQGLAAPLGEFSFGVPQFQQIFHPLLLSVAAAFALVAIRLVLGRWWAVGIAAVNFVIVQLGLLNAGQDGAAPTRAVGLFVVSALVVEAVAFSFGTERRARFAVAAGVGVGTVGLAGEWLWNQHAYQPWRTALLPDAVILSTIAAVGTALLAASFARAAGLQRTARPIPGRLLGAAAAAVVICIVLPLPRHTGDVRADVRVDRVGRSPDGEEVNLTVTLDPPTAADHARWFQASAWQGGGLRLADFKKVGPGRYATAHPVPVEGGWKTLIRLHRGGEMMTVPVFLPADAQIHKPEIPAVDRVASFERETKYLLRETHSGAVGFIYLVYGLLLLALAAWATAFAVAVSRIAPERARVVGGSTDSRLTAPTPTHV
ncbi:MAG: hypothetical protein QOI20_1761 [Acidimicrobiaceae bacterium]|jgi:hypothetical protein|nr:hypothetical protein [Acidimicrobiaceae bacterium]